MTVVAMAMVSHACPTNRSLTTTAADVRHAARRDKAQSAKGRLFGVSCGHQLSFNVDNEPARAAPAGSNWERRRRRRHCATRPKPCADWQLKRKLIIRLNWRQHFARRGRQWSAVKIMISAFSRRTEPPD